MFVHQERRLQFKNISKNIILFVFECGICHEKREKVPRSKNMRPKCHDGNSAKKKDFSRTDLKIRKKKMKMIV